MWMLLWKWKMGCIGQCGPFGLLFPFQCDIHHIHTVVNCLLDLVNIFTGRGSWIELTLILAVPLSTWFCLG